MKVKQTIEKEFPGLGERITAARKASDLPLTQLAARAGMSYTNWYKIESGEAKSVPLETIRAMEEALGVDLGVDLGVRFEE